MVDTKFADSWGKDLSGNLWSLELHHEIYPDNPREYYDQMGTMCCWHRRYNLGDKDVPRSVEDFWYLLAEEAMSCLQVLGKADETWDDLDEMDADELASFVHRAKQHIILPLYLYDHSGITMSTAPFSCPWDSGQVGYIYVSMRRLKEEYGDLSMEELCAKGMQMLKSEVAEYDTYIRGDIFRCVIKRNMDVYEEFGPCYSPKYVRTDVDCFLESEGLAESLRKELLAVL